MKFLCVAEKPSIAKSISSILATGKRLEIKNGKHKYCKNYHFPYSWTSSSNRLDVEVVFTSVLGHLMELDIDGFTHWHSCPPECLFQAPLKKQVNQDHAKVQLNLEYECKYAQQLIIWTDCDREGEHIGQEIVQVCTKINPRLQIKRAKFSVLQPREIHYAMQHLGILDEKQCEAVEARMELDLRLGAALTRFLTLRFQPQFHQLQKKVLSYGSCQFPTLGFVVDRYQKVQNFISEPFYKLQVKLKTSNEGDVVFQWNREKFFDLPLTRLLLDVCLAHPYGEIIRREEHLKKKYKPYPLNTVEFQKLGTKHLKLSSDQLMRIAEQLYQKGFISYPRTETNRFAKNFNLKPLITIQRNHPVWGHYASALLDEDLFDLPRQGKNDDQAHPPIHPTKYAPDLLGDEKKVYQFITKRFLSCCSKDAEAMETNLELEVAQTERFHASGLIIFHRYFLDIDPCIQWQGSVLPSSDSLQLHATSPVHVELLTSKTCAPDLLTESDLIGEMDKHGIGTDATIHEHIKKVLDREYILRQPSSSRSHASSSATSFLVPSTLGLALINGMDLVSPIALSKPILRSTLEMDLKAICEGKKLKHAVVQHSLQQFQHVYRQTVIKAYLIEEALQRNLMGGT
ncbi:DNA topoisomerase 3-alpha [Coelomomyces lativittatus]|nr:DNA topoisomerase 3-alpha [Coelomomyces lativittatus]KAJ1517107.1 DNA topoisomerase 3-alpha [Coelomomyces lativittatus]